jgi:hypothetical protein
MLVYPDGGVNVCELPSLTIVMIKSAALDVEIVQDGMFDDPEFPLLEHGIALLASKGEAVFAPDIPKAVHPSAYDPLQLQTKV